MPNRRRRRLSTAMSAVAALAVASPAAVVAVSELSASTEPAPQQREFVQAAMITDLPNELIVGAVAGPVPVRHQSAADADGSADGLGRDCTNDSDVAGTGNHGSGNRAVVAGTRHRAIVPGSRHRAADHAGPGAAVGDHHPARCGTEQSRAREPGAHQPDRRQPDRNSGGCGTTAPATGARDRAGRGSDDAVGHRPGADADLGHPAPSEVPISAPIGLDPLAGTYPLDPSLATLPAGAPPAAVCSATCPAPPTNWAPARPSTCSRAW